MKRARTQKVLHLRIQRVEVQRQQVEGRHAGGVSHCGRLLAPREPLQLRALPRLLVLPPFCKLLAIKLFAQQSERGDAVRRRSRVRSK
jgi:hypothetical protein